MNPLKQQWRVRHRRFYILVSMTPTAYGDQDVETANLMAVLSPSGGLSRAESRVSAKTCAVSPLGGGDTVFQPSQAVVTADLVASRGDFEKSADGPCGARPTLVVGGG